MRHATIAHAVATTLCMGAPAAALAQTWTPLVHQPAFKAAATLLLTDGTVMVQEIGDAMVTRNWYKLTPDSAGSYVNGSWSQLASLQKGYAPLYFASQVLPDGRVIINGGEYNGRSADHTTQGSLYDPVADSWTPVNPPFGWAYIGDAQSVLLSDGTYMLANCCTKQAATLNLSTMQWTATGADKNDNNNEEGWTLLPSGQVLTVDANDTNDVDYTEILTNGSWAFAGNTPQELPDLKTATNSHELGPQMLRPDGTVVAIGATGYTAIYSTRTATWSKGPTFPRGGKDLYDVADGPAALLTTGNILIAASPGVFKRHMHFFEFTKNNTLVGVPSTPNAPRDSSFEIRLLPLPNGQVLQTDFSADIEIYTPKGKPDIRARPPRIVNFPATVTPGQSYTLAGVYLNGFSAASAYGDDAQSATNYPLVRMTNQATGHVRYARTTGFSSMAVANPKAVTAQVAVPADIETGASWVEVVANGISSAKNNLSIR